MVKRVLHGSKVAFIKFLIHSIESKRLLTRETENVISNLLIPITAKLDDLLTKSDFKFISKSSCRKVEQVEEKIVKMEREINEVQLYITRYDLRIFNIPIDVLKTATSLIGSGRILTRNSKLISRKDQ